MKISLFLFAILPLASCSQRASLPLNFSSYGISMSVANDQNIVLTSKVGEVGTGSMHTAWKRKDIHSDELSLGITVEQPNFFNKDTGFVSGFISNNDSYNIIYHTTDGGAHWSKIDFGQSGWIDHAVNLDNGEAWLSVAGSGIAYTSDYGFTWKKFTTPEIKERFATIFFNPKREGIIGSLWNMLAYTSDNCNSWKLIPTPLDQKQYDRTNAQSRPEFNKVAIYKDYFLVKQEKLVFYSKRDTISWIPLPQYDNFYTDGEASTLFFRTANGEYVRCFKDLSPLYTFKTEAPDFDGQFKKASLFLVNRKQLVQITQENNMITTDLTGTDTDGADPVTFDWDGSTEYALRGNKIFWKEYSDKKWHFLFTFPFSLDNGKLSLAGDKTILFKTLSDSLYYFDFSGRIQKSIRQSEMLQDFSKAGIHKVIFELGGAGCFHRYDNQLIYTKEGKQFSGPIGKSSDSKGLFMPENDIPLSMETVLQFTENLPALFDPNNSASIQDFAFTREEYEQCKKDIREFQKKEKKPNDFETSGFHFSQTNLDFKRLLSLVDSIESDKSPELRNKLYDLGAIQSTSSTWKKILFINNNNEVLDITCSYDWDYNYFLPWRISLNGLSITTTNYAVHRFIEKVYPALLQKEDRVGILHALVKTLYLQ